VKRSQRVRRGAVVGLAVILLGLTALSVIGAFSTRQSADAATRSVSLSDAYNRAHTAVAAEESLERKYRLEPGTEVRGRHVQAGADLDHALADIYQRGDADDQALVGSLRSLHAEYAAAISRLFAAVDAGWAAEVLRLDNEQVDPLFDRISGLVQAETDEHARGAAEALRQLHRVEGIVFVTTIAGFGVGLALLGACVVVAVGYQRVLLRQAADSQHRALHDALTGLPNRTLFNDRVAQVLHAGRRTGDTAAVMILDLDRFKEVNDTLGHEYGDELLRQVGARTSDVLRESDTIARLSADEYAILLPGTGEAEAADLAQRVLSKIHRSFIVGDVTVDIEASVGLAVSPGHAGTSDALVRCADIAMHQAKDAKAGVVLYRPEMHTENPVHLSLLGDLRRALDASDQLTLHYQPKISLHRGEICGVEALVRWRHPTRGTIAPAEFIPIAETTGLINHLTRRVLRLAISQARAWLDAGASTAVAVNLSPRCLLDPELIGYVTGLLQEFGLPTHLLRLEVTETAVMANPALAMTTLHQLKDLGIRLAIDDYGTGHSSMAYLKRLPVDELKVDRSFVQNMDSDQNDAALVRSAIDLGHNLGLTVVAEGVENAAHVAALRGLGCDVAQGYHYARPMPADELTTWLTGRDLSPSEIASHSDR
jgi:diguanylate cyclase (GGDEF)-like protein